MRITHLSTYDLSGGAARAAYRLHRGLLSLGHESRMLTLYMGSSDPTVLQFVPPMDIPTRLRRGLERRMLEREGSKLAGRPAGATFFTDDRSQHGADALRRLPATDVLNLHWVAGFIDYRAFFQKLPHGLPVVWTLHDMNPFTGGCHYDEACGRFQRRCGACPQIDSSDAKDCSSHVWGRKREAYSSRGGKRLQVITPSHWLAGEARKSSLLSGHNITVIPYGLDTDHFQPRDRRLARERYGIPVDAKTILFVADSAAEKRKGLKVLLEALGGLESSGGYFFVVIGRGGPTEGLGNRFKKIDFLQDEAALSYVYSAADVFVIPSLQDNLPNTALEALACGVPLVGSRVGGVPEIVREGTTGVLVEPANPQALASAIKDLVGDPERRKEMSANCRLIALEEYALEVQARRYVRLYSSLLEAAS